MVKQKKLPIEETVDGFFDRERNCITLDTITPE